MSSFRTALVQSVNQRFFYGWLIVGVGSLGIFTSGPGQSHTFSVFLDAISTDLNVSNAEIASAYGLATFFAALLLPQLGRFIDRFGPRTMLIVITVFLGLACAAFGAAANFVMLAVGFGLLRFLGQGSLMMGCANLVSQWFNQKRGLAMSLMALGFGISMAIHPPLGQYLVAEVGWRQAWVILGVLTWVIMLPPILLLVHNTPEEVGLRPDGMRAHDTETDNSAPVILGLTLHEALKTSSFYLLSFGWFAIAMLVTTLHFYQVSILTAQGVSETIAARAFPISAITMVATMPLVGWLLDTFKTRYVFALGLLVTATSLVSITFATSLPTLIMYAVVFGFNNACSMTLFGYLWPRYFGRKYLGSIQGTGQMIGVVGASFGPIPVGFAFDVLESPTLTLQVLAVYPLLAAVLMVLFLRTHTAVMAGNERLE